MAGAVSPVKTLSQVAAYLGTTLNTSGDELVVSVVIDSRRIVSGSVWFALPHVDVAGLHTTGMHGATYLTNASTSPLAIVTDEMGAEILQDCPAPLIVLADPRTRVGDFCAWFYDYPARHLTTVGVTGTNGKTSITRHLAEAWHGLGLESAALGTLGCYQPGRLGTVNTGFTTPEADTLQRLLAQLVADGVTHLAMEVSSHALVLGRVDGIEFDCAVFTNLSHDHLDFHGDMADYFAAKSRLFESQRTRHAVVCVNDSWGNELSERCRERGIDVNSYATTVADWTWTQTGPDEITIHSATSSWTSSIVAPGDFNAENLVATVATLVATGTAHENIEQALAGIKPVPGRMERIGAELVGVPAVYVDYAHSPDSVSRVVEAAKPSSGRVIAVLGAGGDRDRAKRPAMGAAASSADLVIVTDDNPRHEDAATIREQVLAGVTAEHVRNIGDRAKAITSAIHSATMSDVVVILGKGAEPGQQYGDVIEPFDDRDVASAALREWGADPC